MGYVIIIPLELEISIVTNYSKNLVAMETDRCPDHNTIMSAILWLQGLKLSRPKYSFKNGVTHGSVLIFTFMPL